MMKPGEKKVLRTPIAQPSRTAYGNGRGLDWADGAVQTLFGQNGASAGATLFGEKAVNKDAPALAALATDILLIGVKIMETPHLGDPESLKKLLLSYFKDFERSCTIYSKPAELVNHARYALAAFIDETIINTANNCREQWINSPLQVEFFDDNSAGEHFFKRLEELIPDIRRNLEAVEVYSQCLALGFQGRYRVGNAELLPNVVRNLLKRIESVRGTPPKALSPSAYAHPGTQGQTRSGKPLLIGATVLVIIAITSFFLMMAASDGPLDTVRELVARLEAGARS
jgi:type VI secretion system protein ImpK